MNQEQYKRIGRSYADELTTEQRSRAIDLLKEEKLPAVGEYEKELDRRTYSDPLARVKAR